MDCWQVELTAVQKQWYRAIYERNLEFLSSAAGSSHGFVAASYACVLYVSAAQWDVAVSCTICAAQTDCSRRAAALPWLETSGEGARLCSQRPCASGAPAGMPGLQTRL